MSNHLRNAKYLGSLKPFSEGEPGSLGSFELFVVYQKLPSGSSEVSNRHSAGEQYELLGYCCLLMSVFVLCFSGSLSL